MSDPETPVEEEWVPIASADLTPGAIVETNLDSEELIVWRTQEGFPCVMEARCPHQWSHLGAEGVVEGEEIVCLTHCWRFSRNGEGWKAGMTGRRDRKGDIMVLPCKEESNQIWIQRRKDE